MSRLRPEDLTEIDRDLLRDLNRETLEKLAWQAVELARELSNRLGQNSSNSSRPPSSDPPYRRQADRQKTKDAQGGGPDWGADGGGGAAAAGPGAAAKPPAKPSGKRPGQRGHWRRQPIVAEDAVDHDPAACQGCGAPRDVRHRQRQDGAHDVYDLDRTGPALRLTCRKHRYFVSRCECGAETVARPGTGRSSVSDRRKRPLTLTERCLVGPTLATLIAALALRYRLSRTKIQEFLRDWLGLELGVATIERCLHEVGLACEPVVEELLAEVRTAPLVHVDETPWYQGTLTRWLWVVVTATTVVFHIGRRGKEDLTSLIGEAFLGGLVSDGYAVYRDHPRRQRCLAHLIRKALALATGFYRVGSGFGRDVVRDLRALIATVAEGGREDRAKRLVARLQWACQRNQDETEEKVRALAREILADWDAVIAFVHDPTLPPTNNDAERALRHAVIARRLSFGTRTAEGSRFYAAALSVIETCRKRAADTWAYVRDLLQTARAGAASPPLPQPAAARQGGM